MKNRQKQKLIDLGAEKLADALIELSGRFCAAEELIDRLVSSSNDNLRRFKTRLKDLTEFERYWSDSTEFTHEMESMLQDLKLGSPDPFTGIELVASFYGTADYAVEHCHDSDGDVEYVYSIDAKELFIEYASECQEKEKIVDIILQLNQNDSYGMSKALIDCVGQFLPERNIRHMITMLQKSINKEKDGYQKECWRKLVESLARQLKDAPLFERTRITSEKTLSPNSYTDISRVYLESGNAQTALAWLEKMPEEEKRLSFGRETLLLEVYKQLDNTEKVTELLYQHFRDRRSTDAFEKLLAVIGNDKRDQVVAEEVPVILIQRKLSVTNAMFLIKNGKVDEAEKYLLDRVDQLNGNDYINLPSLADAMRAEERNFVATLIYRSLLDSLLERGYAKAYHHGAQYLKRMDQIAPAISDWREFENHETYKAGLLQEHGRKRSFWSKYKAKR